MSDDFILKISGLSVEFDTETGPVRAVDQVDMTLPRGKTMGLVGESGCGKSVTALSIMRLLPRPTGRIVNGRILYQNEDLIRLPASHMHHIRGNRIAMIFQEPMTALNPVHRIEQQIKEMFNLHFPHMEKYRVVEATLDMLSKVGISDPERRMKEYPHQLSGGMRQRVMIAMALACKPDILIADEPTTGLDVTIQAQILALMDQLKQETGMAILFITHDLGVIARMCDDVVVMYAGKIAESAPVASIFNHPAHPYTKGLLASVPRLDGKRKTRLHIIKGMVPSLSELPQGCRFENRCPSATAECAVEPPDMIRVDRRHYAACRLLHPK